MKRPCLIGMLALLLLGGLTGYAEATLISDGDPATIGSWAQRFQEDGVGPFNLMGIVSPVATFEHPTFAGFSAPGWSLTSESADFTHAAAAGPSLSWLQFDIHFLGSSADPLVFDFFAYNGATLKEAAHASWSGGGWTITPLAFAPPAATFVPEPGLILLMATGVVGLVAAKARKG